MTTRGLESEQPTTAAVADWPTVLVGYPANHPTIVLAGLVPAIHGLLLFHDFTKEKPGGLLRRVSRSGLIEA
jgi:hypothetical protein